MNGFQKFWGHLSTITRHRHKVIAHCAKAGILWQGLRHDLSKYGLTEFRQGVRFFDGTHSPTEDERKTYGYSLAWMHHKGHNRHHWEYWTDYSIEKQCYVAMPMPRRFLAEMILRSRCRQQNLQGRRICGCLSSGVFAARQNARPYASGNLCAAAALFDTAQGRGRGCDVYISA